MPEMSSAKLTRFRIGFILSVILATAPDPLPAAEWAWIMSIPHAISSERIYKVRILEIDGESQPELLRYAVEPGRHVVKVRMLLSLTWEPDLAEAPPGPGTKEITLDTEAGGSYRLAARLDDEAPIEAQLDQSYWTPIVYGRD